MHESLWIINHVLVVELLSLHSPFHLDVVENQLHCH